MKLTRMVIPTNLIRKAKNNVVKRFIMTVFSLSPCLFMCVFNIDEDY